jgi:amino acid adenylation domain-containing protein
MEDIVQRIAKLPPHQRTMLESALFEAPPKSDETLALRPRADDGPRPLSFAQERLWFLDQLQPGTSTYNLPLMLPLEGAVNPGAVQAAIGDLVRRHEVLRTRIGLLDGRPVQLVANGLDVPVARIDLRNRPATFNVVVQVEVLRPFDLSSGLLLRATLIELDDRHSRLLVVMHHIISDGWSIAIFAREFAMLYAARCRGHAATLPPLPIQYADYAEWQRKRLAGPRGSTLLAYWLDNLAGAPQVFTLPCKRDLSTRRDAAGATHVARLPATAAARALARAEGTTLFTVLLAGFFALLHRFSGEDDILVGIPAANRDQVELEPLIGLFVNTLPLRSRVDRHTSFRTLVKQMRKTVLDADANKDLPFEQLVSRLVSTRDATRPPLVQVLFAVESGAASLPSSPPAASDDGVDTIAAPAGPAGAPANALAPRAKFDLTLTVQDAGDILTGLWDYSTGVYDPSAIAALAQSFGVLLSTALSQPDQAIGRLPLLEPKERDRLLRRADNAAPTRAGLPGTLEALVAAKAARTPDATAVIGGDTALSFAELISGADQLAGRLRAVGVSPGARVGVCLSRSPRMIVGLLAILRLGCAYVPLDPDYPDDRLAYMAADAGLVLILTEQAQHQRLIGATAKKPIPLALVETAASAEQLDGSETRPAVAGPDDLAYVIYTSGSTGRPKGVAISHRAIVNQMRWFVDTWPLGPGDRVLQRTSLSFDASVWEIFAPLISGATLVLSGSDAASFASIGAEIRRHGVTVVQLVPSLLRVLLDHGSLDNCSSLRLMFCGGEALPGQLVRRVAAVTDATVVNLYGPTEASINATFHVVDGDPPDSCVPIGRPAAGLRTYVLDDAMEPVPPGAVGELYLGGVGLAWGYVGKPDLTAAAFVPDPFGGEPGSRLYRTGDLAFRRRDGLLEFRGRHDHQVKVRGFRIELAEVEAALTSLPTVAAAIVLAQDDRLIAWVVPRDNVVLSLEHLRSGLVRLVPSYMIPATYIPVASIPLLPNGKADRRALPCAGARRITSDVSAEPETDTERLLAEMWANLLRAGPVGRHDDFFALGGHSLLAVQLSSRVYDRFGVTLPLRQVFETPTVAALAHYVENAVNASASPPLSSAFAAKLSETERQRLLEQIDEIPEHQIDALLLTLADGARADGNTNGGDTAR